MIEHTTTLVWEITGTTYKVLNVPGHETGYAEKEYFDLDVTVKLAMIRDLMVADEIPHVVDFREIADFAF